MNNLTRILISVSLILLSSACTSAKVFHNPDPFEKFNREMLEFNMSVDTIFVKPIALMYNKVTPPVFQHRISNFFDNVDLITTIPNDILQLKIAYAGSDIWRLIFNSTIGLAGLYDPATYLGLPKHHEDFGLTLAYWSKNKKETYLVLPLIGPTTMRATFGYPADLAASPYPYISPYYYPLAAKTLYYINLRSSLLPADKLVREAFDPYILIRDAYLQRRQEMIMENATPAKRNPKPEAAAEEAEKRSGPAPMTAKIAVDTPSVMPAQAH